MSNFVSIGVAANALTPTEESLVADLTSDRRLEPRNAPSPTDDSDVNVIDFAVPSVVLANA